MPPPLKKKSYLLVKRFYLTTLIMNLFFSNSAFKLYFFASKSHSLPGLVGLFGKLYLKIQFLIKKWPRKRKGFCSFFWVIFGSYQKNDLRYRKFEKGELPKIGFKVLESHYSSGLEQFLVFRRLEIRFACVNLKKKLISEAKGSIND